jgi:hypothetical protein
MECPNCGDRVDPPYLADDDVRHIAREASRRYLVIAVGDTGHLSAAFLRAAGLSRHAAASPPKCVLTCIG